MLAFDFDEGSVQIPFGAHFGQLFDYAGLRCDGICRDHLHAAEPHSMRDGMISFYDLFQLGLLTRQGGFLVQHDDASPGAFNTTYSTTLAVIIIDVVSELTVFPGQYG